MLNVVNPKFVQLIDSGKSNSGINTNKTVARLVNLFPMEPKLQTRLKQFADIFKIRKANRCID